MCDVFLLVCFFVTLSNNKVCDNGNAMKQFYCRAVLCISAAIAGTRWLSVCLSVTFVSCAKPSGSQAILVFARTKRDDANPTGTPLTGASNARGIWKMTIFDQYLVWETVIDRLVYVLRDNLKASHSLSIHTTFSVIAPGASPGETKMW